MRESERSPQSHNTVNPYLMLTANSESKGEVLQTIYNNSNRQKRD